MLVAAAVFAAQMPGALGKLANLIEMAETLFAGLFEDDFVEPANQAADFVLQYLAHKLATKTCLDAGDGTEIRSHEQLNVRLKRKM